MSPAQAQLHVLTASRCQMHDCCSGSETAALFL